MMKLNDIAMVKLNQTLDFNGEFNYLEPMCIPTKNQTINDNRCYAVESKVSGMVYFKPQNALRYLTINCLVQMGLYIKFDLSLLKMAIVNGHGI